MFLILKSLVNISKHPLKIVERFCDLSYWVSSDIILLIWLKTNLKIIPTLQLADSTLLMFHSHNYQV